jgi:hypothetical protein|tara:strand:- start:4394 stop:5491 length:1098 start_codon:yes stop_codon:yes gene_type:complete
MTTPSTETIINYLSDTFGVNIQGTELHQACRHFDISYQTITKRLENYKVDRGQWNLSHTVDTIEKSFNAPSAQPSQTFIPTVDDTFVPFGSFSDIKKIIKSNLFYPAFITGLSGNGKTFAVEQACAQLGREFIRVNITIETDESDLIGSLRLSDPRGSTITDWQDGPVVQAMRRGAVLLLDEVDLASNKIMCLQPILEGKPLFIKLTGEYVTPAPGFNVIATANTKGQGSPDGRFIGTNIMNEAFLERFPVTFEQQYPATTTEMKILTKVCNQVGVDDNEFCMRLIQWARRSRSLFDDDRVSGELISTRRLVAIIRAYSIWGKKEKALEVCLNRFSDEIKESFLEAYDKYDEDFELKEVDNDIKF